MSTAVVNLQEGKIKGKLSQDFLGGTYYSFLGIPYAETPTGNFRFKAPVPVEPWKGIRDATTEGPECPSLHMLFGYHVGSEDNCLHLNVYTRELPHNCGSMKPVMVWIHGGGFLFGSNKSDLYGPEYLITEDIVLVCINYRLGVLGFLSLEDPSLDVPGNAGLKDMVLALHWVQRNIQKFCGDSNNVTIFGESAGAASVHYLLLSPLSKGLFHKAIAQSGCSLNNWTRGSRGNARLIAKNLGYEETDERKILEYLRRISSRKIVEAQLKTPDLFKASSVRPFGPVVETNAGENAFLNEEPIDIIKSGKFHHVPLIMGYNSREGIFLSAVKQMQMKLGHKTTDNKFEDEIFYYSKQHMNLTTSEKVAEGIKKYYYQEEDHVEQNIDILYLLRTDNMFLYEIHKCVSLLKMVSQAPIYFYRMTLDTSNNHIKEMCTTKHIYVLMSLYFLIGKLSDGRAKRFLFNLTKRIPKSEHTGTCHADDLFYLFKTFINETFEEGDKIRTYVMRFIRMWANFARTGNPTPDKNDPLMKTTWMPVTKDENCLLNIDNELEMKSDPDLERVTFWTNILNSF